MRRIVLGIVTLLVLAPGMVRAEYKLADKLSVAASLRTRGEFWNWFEPPVPGNNDYAFAATVARAALQWKDAAFDATLEAQNSALLGLPDDAVALPPQGALGLGAVYFLNNRRENDASVFLKQGFVNLKRLGVEGLNLKGGRFEFSDAAEVMTGDPSLDWLKNARLSQRLIGPFGWSHVGRSFDGVQAGFTRAPLNVTALAAHPTQGGFDLAGMKEIREIDLGYLSFNLTRPEFDKQGDGRLFYVYYGDGRGLLKSDNRAPEVRALDRQDISIHSEGAHWIQLIPTSAGPFDALAWGVIQQGEWGALDHRAWAWDVETGWQPAALPAKPWIRAGFGRTSGDDDALDGDHGTFFQILPTARVYSFSAFYNLMNNQDAFAELILRPRPGLVSRTDVHALWVTESRDLWYQGAGATVERRDVGFGYPGRPSSGRNDLFRVVETSLSYDWTAWLSTNVYYAHVFGGSVVNAIFTGDQADFGYLEATLKL